MRKQIKAAAFVLAAVFMVVCVSCTMVPESDADTWDGSTVDTNWYDASSESFSISTAAQLAGLAQIVSGTANDITADSFQGKTVTLAGNIDLANHEWTPIGDGSRSGGTLSGDVFKGTFNGGNFTISNLKISTHTSQGVGLFSFLIGGSISDLNLSGVSITTSQESTGALVGAMSDGATISNVKIISGSVQGNQGVGGVVGRILSEGSVKNCTNAATIKGVNATEKGYNIGGIVGAAYYMPSGDGMLISGCTNSGAVDSPTVCSGGIVGLSMGTVENCTNSGVVTGGGCSIGGIAGEQQNYGMIKGCENLADGKVSNTSTEPGTDEANPSRTGGMGTGGIVGWVRYIGPETTYTGKTTISVINCSNAAPVSTQSTHAGGIIGAVYHAVVMTGCSNTGLVSSTSFAGGLIGGMQTLDAYHPTDGCRLVMTNNSSTSAISDTISTSGWAIGHFSAAATSESQNCSITNGSNWTVYGNKYNGIETDVPEIQSVVTITAGGNVYGYPSITQAISGTTGEVTITLIDDINENVVIPAERSITIDLAGHTLTNAGSHTIVNKGTLVINDSAGGGVVDNTTHAMNPLYNEVGATATLNGGKFTRSQEAGTSSTNSGGNSAYCILNHGTMTVNEGVTVESTSKFSSLFENGWYNGNQNTTEAPSVLTINGGTFTGGINTIKNDDYGETEINGGTFSNMAQAAVLNWNEMTISDGEFSVSSGYSVILNGYINNTMDKGTLTITGGTFTGDVGVQMMEGSGSTGIGTVAVSGGTFNVDDTFNPRSGTKTEISVTGGSFKQDLSESDPTFIEGGFNDMILVDGMYTPTITEGGVASIGNVYYPTLQAAIDAVPADGTQVTIELRGSVSVGTGEFILVSEGKSIVLNLNGKNITKSDSNNNTPVIQNEGTLTINGSGTISNDSGTIWNYSVLKLSGLTVNTGWYGIDNYGTVDVIRCTVNASGNGYTGLWNGPSAIATVTDSTFNGTNGSGGTESQGGTMTLTGCTFTQAGLSDNMSFRSTAIAVSKGGTVDVYGCSFSVPNFGFYVFSSGGTINVHSGTYETTGTRNMFQLDVNNTTYPSAYADVNISGGSFTGSVPASLGSNREISVSGGSFSSDVTSYLEAGYNLSGTDGNFAVVEGWTVYFTVGEDVYPVDVSKGQAVSSIPAEISGTYVWKDSDSADGSVYTIPFTPTGDMTLWGTSTDATAYTVSIRVDGIPITGSTVTLTAEASSGTGEELTGLTYVWTKDGVQISAESSILVTQSGRYTVIISNSDGSQSGTASTTLNFVLPTYTVTFVYDGTETPVHVTSGDTAMVPEIEVPEGFELVWMTENDTVWNPSSAIRSDMKLTGELRILAPEVTITKDMEAYIGATVTLTATFDEVEGLQYIVLWSNEDTTPSIQVTDSGTYSVTVTVSCEGYESVTATAEIAVEFRPVVVTFDLNGDEKTAETTYGGTVEAPDFGVSEGFHVVWTVDGQPWDSSEGLVADTTVVGELALDTPNVKIDVSGSTVTGLTATLTALVDNFNGIIYSFEWSTGDLTGSIDVTESGTYTVTVTAEAPDMELDPVINSKSMTLEFGEFGFIDDSITVYAGFGPYRPGFIGVEGTVFSSSDDSVVSVDDNGKLTFEAGDLARDVTVTITATAELDGRTLEDTYRMTVLSEHHDMVTGDGIHNPVVEQPATSEVRDIWNEYLRPEVSAGDLPQTSRSDWTVVDIFIPDDDGHVSEGGEFTVPFDYFGVPSADGYVFHIVHIVGGDAVVLVKDTDFFVEDDGVRIVVDSFSPFAFYAEPEAATPDDPDTPVVPGGDDDPSTPSQPSQPSHPGYDDDDEYVPPSGGTIIITPGGSTTTTTTTDDDDDDMKVAIVACAAVGVLAALIAVFVWTDRKS